jgi:alkylhydroperoxidase family enzyme
MTWIESVPPEEARGPLLPIYEACRRKFGFVPNIRRSMSLNPPALRAYVQLSNAVYAGGPLPAAEREMVATVVSALNGCRY